MTVKVGSGEAWPSRAELEVRAGPDASFEVQHSYEEAHPPEPGTLLVIDGRTRFEGPAVQVVQLPTRKWILGTLVTILGAGSIGGLIWKLVAHWLVG